MTEFLRVQFRLGAVMAEQVAALVARGRLTQAQADYITSEV